VDLLYNALAWILLAIVPGISANVGVAIGGRIPAIAGPLVTGIMASQIGIGNVARWFALIWVFLIVGYLIGPETKGKSLAELDAADPAGIPGGTERVTLGSVAPVRSE
jgi:hypothetical protein